MKNKPAILVGAISLLTIAILGLFFPTNKIDNILGAATPPSGYSTTLSGAETSTDATINVSSVTLGDDTAMTSASIYPGIFLTIEPASSAKREIIFCTGISVLTFTGCTRGLAFIGSSMAAVTANQESHQSGSQIIASDPSQFYSYMLVNAWNEQWVESKLHFKSATSSDRTGISLGDGSANDIFLIFDDNSSTSTNPRLYRQESTGNLIWSGNGIDEITLGGTAVSSTGGRGIIAEAVSGGSALNVATSTDDNSGNKYGLKFLSQGGRDRLIFSGYYNATDFTLASLIASSTYIRNTAGVNQAYIDNSGNISASGTLDIYGVPTFRNIGIFTGAIMGSSTIGSLYVSSTLNVTLATITGLSLSDLSDGSGLPTLSGNNTFTGFNSFTSNVSTTGRFNASSTNSTINFLVDGFQATSSTVTSTIRGGLLVNTIASASGSTTTLATNVVVDGNLDWTGKKMGLTQSCLGTISIGANVGSATIVNCGFKPSLIKLDTLQVYATPASGLVASSHGVTDCTTQHYIGNSATPSFSSGTGLTLSLFMSANLGSTGTTTCSNTGFTISTEQGSSGTQATRILYEAFR